ncbi:MAG TPA: ferritin-like domain-containing protein [Terriglobales bacterium]|nr:ferritin-like domain-containing protein [Terriglobales bacterium]
MKLESLRSLLLEQLQDLYSAEQQITKALPKMIERTSDGGLKSALSEHLDITREQVRRLDHIFDEIRDGDRDGSKCKGMEGLLKEGEEIIKAKGDPETRDAGIIASAQRVEHYEIAGYGCARTYASLLGRRDWAQQLQQTLDEEKEADQKLNQLAERINVEAKAA